MNNESFKGDDLTKKVLEKAGMEQPSYSFTSRIMEQIRLSHSPEVFIYQPVIARKTWTLLAAAIVTVSLLFMYVPATQSPAGNDFGKYIIPAQNIIDTATSVFSEKLSMLHSLSWMAFALIAGWMLFAMDKVLRKLKSAE